MRVTNGEYGEDVPEARLKGMVFEESSMDVLFDGGEHCFGIFGYLLEQLVIISRVF